MCTGCFSGSPHSYPTDSIPHPQGTPLPAWQKDQPYSFWIHGSLGSLALLKLDNQMFIPQLAPGIYLSNISDLATGVVQSNESGGSSGHLGGLSKMPYPEPHSQRMELSEFAGGQICIFEVFQVIPHLAVQVSCTLGGWG